MRCHRLCLLLASTAVFLAASACASSDLAPSPCALCQAPSITCARGPGVESVTLILGTKNAHGCDAQPGPGLSSESFHLRCEPLEACKLGSDTCYAATFENDELTFSTPAYSYTCWLDP